MFFVMLIHAPLPDCSGLANGVAWVLKDFLASGAVPMFFLLSGYLSADRLNPKRTTTAAFFGKLQKLIIPFLFWNALLLALVLAIKQLPVAISPTEGGSHASWLSVQTNSAWDIMSALLGIGRSPIVYQFWFLRDLIVANIVAFFLVRPFPFLSLAGWLLLFLPLSLWASCGFFFAGFSVHRFLRLRIKPSVSWPWLFMLTWLGVGAVFWGVGIRAPHALLQLGGSLWLLSVALVVSRLKMGGALAPWAPVCFLCTLYTSRSRPY